MKIDKTNPASILLILLLALSFAVLPVSAQQQKLITKTIEQGVGEPAEKGDEVLIHEETRYRDGTLIFSSYQMDPLKVTIGAKQMIEGLDQGLVGMRKGELRELVVPPALSQRKFYPDSLHPDSVLVYQVRLVDILKPGN